MTTFSQFFPPKAELTEANLPTQTGKVFVVTGGASGIGYELSQMLYEAGAKVYIAGRSENNASEAIKNIKAHKTSKAATGELHFLQLQLDDLSTIKASVDLFKTKESQLHVLWNNAGVSMPPSGSASKQGYELQLATNVLGPLLFTELLLPLMRDTAKISPPASVRVVWAGSIVVDMGTPSGGLDMAVIQKKPSPGGQSGYAASKVGNWFVAAQMAKAVESGGILSVVANPGNLRTNLTRHVPYLKYLVSFMLHKPVYGAYTFLWAGLAPDLTSKDNGAYVIPWGRKHPAPRADLVKALQTTEEGGTGQAQAFWNWCQAQIKEYL